MDLLHEKIREHAEKRAEMLESYIASYLRKTGLSVTDIVFVEQRSDDGLRTEWHCEPKKVMCDIDGCGKIATVTVGDLHFCSGCNLKVKQIR